VTNPVKVVFGLSGMGVAPAGVEKAGTHTLQLIVADQNHIPHHPVVISERITITVK